MQFPDFYEKGPTPCSESDPDLFFADPDQPMHITKTNKGKAVCNDADDGNGCPYKSECLAWALANNEPGVWGGTSQNERRSMRTAARRAGNRAAVYDYGREIDAEIQRRSLLV